MSMLLDQQNNNDNKPMPMLDACKSFLSGTLQLFDEYQLPKEGWLHIFNLGLNFLFLFGHILFLLFLVGGSIALLNTSFCLGWEGFSAILVGCGIALLNVCFRIRWQRLSLFLVGCSIALLRKNRTT
jgi:hypothetical protein